jgi:hypothetical protein
MTDSCGNQNLPLEAHFGTRRYPFIGEEFTFQTDPAPPSPNFLAHKNPQVLTISLLKSDSFNCQAKFGYESRILAQDCGVVWIRLLSTG